MLRNLASAVSRRPPVLLTPVQAETDECDFGAVVETEIRPCDASTGYLPVHFISTTFRLLGEIAEAVRKEKGGDEEPLVDPAVLVGLAEGGREVRKLLETDVMK